jgi:hypothetical protein
MGRFNGYTGRSVAWSACTDRIIITEVPIWVEVWPYDTTSIEAVLSYGNTLAVGSDVDYSVMDSFIEDFYGDNVYLRIGLSDDWSDVGSSDLVIQDGELAVFAKIRIRPVPS